MPLPQLERLDSFGDQSLSIEHEWPTKDQLRQILREGKRPKLCRILYKNSGSLTGFQLEFTDGLKSPMFETERAKKKDQVCFTDVD